MNLKRYKETDYYISKDGKVYSKKRKELKEISYSILSGYKCVKIFIKGKRYNKYIHRLVTECFIENYNDDLVIKHIDNNKLNNSVDNLSIVSKSNINYYKKKNKNIKYKLINVLSDTSIIVNSLKEIEMFIGYKNIDSVYELLKSGVVNNKGYKIEKVIKEKN